MFIGRHYRRKKRPLPLCDLRTPQKKPHLDMSRWTESVHYGTGREHLWFQSVINSHSACCGCGDPLLHFTALAERYGLPQGPGPARPAAVSQPPAIRRARHPAAAPDRASGAPALPWHGDGGNEGAAGGGDAASPEGGFEDDGLDALVAALDENE